MCCFSGRWRYLSLVLSFRSAYVLRHDFGEILMVKRVLKIYIAGPMTGYPDYNRAAFNAKASELMSEGHIVLNPAVLPGGLCQSEYMDICLAMVRSADAIYLLKGWEDPQEHEQNTPWLKNWS